MTEAPIVKGQLALSSRECQQHRAEWGPDLLNPRRARDDKHSSMRTIGFRSNILFAIAAACGVIAALGRPWYGPSVPDTDDGQMEKLWTDVGRTLTDAGGVDGWTALHTADKLLAGLAVATVLLLVLALIPALQRHVQPLARWGALATVVVVFVKMVDVPDGAATSELRNGAFLALGASLVLLASAWTVAAAPSRRRTPAKAYTPPPAPAYDRDASYGPPQF
jgi:hypothetical protein